MVPSLPSPPSPGHSVHPSPPLAFPLTRPSAENTAPATYCWELNRAMNSASAVALVKVAPVMA